MTTKQASGQRLGGAQALAWAKPVFHLGTAWSKNKYFHSHFSKGRRAGVAQEVPWCIPGGPARLPAARGNIILFTEAPDELTGQLSFLIAFLAGWQK